MTQRTDQDPVTVIYVNCHGEISTRRLILGAICFGTNEYYREPTWLITCYDVDHPAKTWECFNLLTMNFLSPGYFSLTRMEQLGEPPSSATFDDMVSLYETDDGEEGAE